MASHPPPSSDSSDMNRPPADQAQGYLASPAIQNHIHEIAMTFPPPRKQNIACDACRQRKVKCHQLPGYDKCQHCLSKNYPCTHHAQQQTEKKRGASSRRSIRGSTSSDPDPPSSPPSNYAGTSNLPNATLPPMQLPSIRSHPMHHSPYPPPPNMSRKNGNNVPASPPTSSSSVSSHNIIQSSAPPLPLSLPPPPQALPPQTQTSQFLSYMFSNSPSSTPLFSSTSSLSTDLVVRLQDEQNRISLALDLIEVYFQVYHMRIPLINPTQFRARFRNDVPQLRNPDDKDNMKPLPKPLLAVVLAWGSKFSEHNLILFDREQNGPPPFQPHGHRTGGRSTLIKHLAAKAWEVCEDERIYRVVDSDNSVTCLLAEGLESVKYYTENDPACKCAFWVASSLRLLSEMGINRRPLPSAPSQTKEQGEERGTMVFCWWIACLVDAVCSANLRKKPALEDSDYNIQDFPVPMPAGTDMSTVTEQTKGDFLMWYLSFHALAALIRRLSRTLWIPSVEADGIPFADLSSLASAFRVWKEEHLNRVGVPNTVQVEWDYVAAVGACSSDCSYHVQWLIMAQAMEDFGIKELNDAARAGSEHIPDSQLREMENLQNEISDEALNSALRIAGLASVLTTNGYLRLDSSTLHYPILAAGMLLARLGRPEAINCINGLNQYGFAYEEAWDHAREIGQILNANTPPSNSQGSAPRPSSDGDSDMEHYPGDSNRGHPYDYSSEPRSPSDGAVSGPSPTPPPRAPPHTSFYPSAR